MTLILSEEDIGPPIAERERLLMIQARWKLSGAPYSAETVAKVRWLLSMGASRAQVIERTDLLDDKALSAMITKYKLAGPMRKNAKPQIAHDILKRMLKEGASYADIFDKMPPKLFISSKDVREFAGRHGYNKLIPPRHGKHGQGTVVRVWQLIVIEKLTVEQCASVMKMTPGAISGIAWRFAVRSHRVQPISFKRVYGKSKDDLR